MKPTQEPPHNLSAEQAVLADMVLDRKAAIKASNFLSEEDFYRESHKLIFTAAIELLNKNEAINYISMMDLLTAKGQLDSIGGIGYLTGICNASPTTANLEQYMKIIKKEAIKRQLLRFGREVMAGTATGEDVAVQLDQAMQGLNAIANSNKSTDFSDMDSMLDTYIESIASKDPNSNSFSGISTSFAGLDDITNGLQKSDFIILAARPSMGKTAMVLNMVENILLDNEDKDYRIGLFSMEMSKLQLINRLTAILTGIDSKRLECNQLDESEWEMIWKASDILRSAKLYIDDTGGLTMSSLRSRARRLQTEKGLDILFIDYIQLMSGTARGQDRQQAIAEISRSLKALARELNIPIVALSQLSRAVEGRMSKRPLMSDLRESGSLEQDADMIIFLYRDDYYNRNSSQPGVTEMIIAKHRNGPVGTFKFFFEKQHTKFIELL